MRFTKLCFAVAAAALVAIPPQAVHAQAKPRAMVLKGQ
jgi:hypothetical protein